ncbi:MAG: ribosome assembly RNA-binding protein YhbY [Acetivibrionales bacterium]|jgi:RNA-binding protein|nr:ribosome assembly RNA-binding protein YhbY [Clostridiaceae bacterium]
MLTGKQRSYLRSLANEVPALFQIGKNGIDENVIQQFRDALEAKELVKVRVLKNSLYTAREACEEIAQAINAEIVSVIGNKFVLYKESKAKKMIELP